MIITHYVCHLKDMPFDPNDDIQLTSFKRFDIPTLEFTHAGANNRSAFWRFEGIKDTVSEKRVVLLVRDPRDTILSYYHHTSKREGEYDGTLSEFIRDPHVGFARLLIYLNALMLDTEEFADDHVLVSYEQLHNEPEKAIKDVLSFLDITIDNKLMKEAIEFARFDNIKDMERSGKLDNGRFGEGTDGGEDSYKARKGKMGSYQEEMSDADIYFCNTLMNALLPDRLSHYNEK
jgi:hypothetical protein